MAMPWSRAKAIQAEYLSGVRDVKNLTRLFDACFRIQREACEAAGHHIPLVVENVRGAQKWVGRARWHYGSFYLWGDVPALMPIVVRQRAKFILDDIRGGQRRDVEGIYENGKSIKNNGDSWFNIGSPGQKETGRNPVHEAIKGKGGSWFYGADNGTHPPGSSQSMRKYASAMVAKIPFELAKHVGQCWSPCG